MTAVAFRMDPDTRRRLLELRDIDRVMRERGHQRPPEVPVPLTVLARRRIAGLPCDEVMKEGNPP